MGRKDLPASSTAPDPSTRKRGQRLQGSGYSDEDAPVYKDREPAPGVDFHGQRLDGPDFRTWVEDGNRAEDYPPQSYADLRYVDPATGLRVDGVTFDEWVTSGKAADAYPPPGFADRRDVPGEFDEDGFLLDREGIRVPNRAALSEDQRTALQQQHDDRESLRGEAGADVDDREEVYDREGYLLTAAGERVPDREPLTPKEIKARQEQRMQRREERAARRGGLSTVDESRGAVDWPSAGPAATQAGSGRPGGRMGTGGSNLADRGGVTRPTDPVTGLRTDGPSYDEYVGGGMREGSNYPPQGYTDQRLPAGQWPANVPADERNPPQASSTLPPSQPQE